MPEPIIDGGDTEDVVVAVAGNIGECRREAG